LTHYTVLPQDAKQPTCNRIRCYANL